MGTEPNQNAPTDDGELEAGGNLDQSNAAARQDVEDAKEDLKNDPEDPQDETEL